MHRRKLWLLAGVVLAALALAATGSARVNGPASQNSHKAGTLIFGAEQGADLTGRVELYLETAPVPSRSGSAIALEPFVIGIAMIDGIIGGRLQTRDYVGGRGQVGVADTEADHIDASLLYLFFQTVEFGKKIWR